MREVNFSIPSANKAAVSITTALYDRRALDCTSDLPLINSLNNLAYLTTSSGRIRDILTIDGGIERLVTILKEGRSKKMMEIWKWNLAFQCIVNIGVRGSEQVRTRVVEADMVPVIATILDNYFQVMEKCKERQDAENRRRCPLPSLSSRAPRTSGSASRSERRRHTPSAIAIPAPEPAAALPLSSPPERVNFARHHHHHHRSHGSASRTAFPLAPPVPRDVVPSMLPTADSSSQPQSPATPNTMPRPPRPHAIRQQISISGSDEGVVDDASSDEPDTQGDTLDVQPADIVMTDDTMANETVAFPGITTNEDETFNITHRTSTDGSAVNPTVTPTQGQTFNPTQLPPAINPLNATPPQHTWMPRQPFDRSATVLAAMPRDEDVLMSLQLLAYVSKYCNLRSYFQQTHLVPRLKIDKELRALESDGAFLSSEEESDDDDWNNEFVDKAGEQPYNIFPLIEKFTAKPSTRHSTASSQQGDMQYWAGVVMRNLCRKDDSRGGIRQCAYWQCGKWEEYQRQFAKCRRCRRTKYCSKECQKGAWGSHRFWCVAAEDSREGEGSSAATGHGERSHRHHHHHRSHHHHSHP